MFLGHALRLYSSVTRLTVVICSNESVFLSLPSEELSIYSDRPTALGKAAYRWKEREDISVSTAFQILAFLLTLSTRLKVFESDILISVAKARNGTSSYIYFAFRLNIVT